MAYIEYYEMGTIERIFMGTERFWGVNEWILWNNYG